MSKRAIEEFIESDAGRHTHEGHMISYLYDIINELEARIEKLEAPRQMED
jgi:hypothetical protein